MARIESIIPHILKWEVGLKASEKDLSPQKMYESVAKRGFHCVKDDAGGPTMCGVTIGTFISWRIRNGKPKPTVDDLKALDYLEWKEILISMFWGPTQADAIRNQSIAIMLADWRWVNGRQAIRDMQTAFALVPDGIVGPKTLSALNDNPAKEVFDILKIARIQSYHRIVSRRSSQMKFLKGWINRVESIMFEQ